MRCRVYLALVAISLCASACGASTPIESHQGPAEQSVEEDPSSNPITDEMVIDAQLSDQQDDVALRLLHARPIGDDGSSSLLVEVFGVLGNGGDGFVEQPSVNVVTDSGVMFTDIADSCSVTLENTLTCTWDTTLNGSVNETRKLKLEFGYTLAEDSSAPIVFELTASSFENPPSNDPDPTNNVLVVEVDPNPMD